MTVDQQKPVTGVSLDEVLEHIRSRAPEFREQGHVPKDMIAELKQLGVYRAFAPQRFGGEPMHPSAFLDILERIAMVDGSTAWVASFGSAQNYLAALPLDTQAEIYKDGPDIAFTAGLFPMQKAEQVDGGYRVNGKWSFASGCMGSDVLAVGIDGGQAKPLGAVLYPDQLEIVENWDVIGMRGTGSHDLVVSDVVVAPEWTFVRGGEPTVDEPVYRYPSIGYAAQVLAVVNLGLGRAALDLAMAQGEKKGYTSAPALAERAYYRIDIAKADGALRSARAFFYEVTDQTWAIIQAGDEVSDKQKSLVRLAAVEATKVGWGAVHTAYRLSGIAAIQNRHPVLQMVKDAMVITQHAFMAEGMYDAAGAVAMGVPPFPGYL